ncbi:retrovirus-related pol polyprotein from transposon TNT 1-94 [Tanacetum coccineum]
MKIEESLNVTFDETPPPSKTSPLVDNDLDEEEAIKVTEKKNLENDIEDETLEVDEIVNIKESKNHPLDNVIGNLNQITLRSQTQNQSNFFCFISTIEPKNVNEALKDESWIIAMQEELNQFIANDLWELVPHPKSTTIIETKWVYRNNLDENDVVSRNKVRLVAQGYNQQEGIDYDETYAPVARLESIRILLAYACALDFKLFQMDVKSAFLYSFINEEAYKRDPKTSHLDAFYCQYRVNYNLEGQMLVEFVIQTQFFSLTLEEFGQILGIPFEGHCSFFDKCSLNNLESSVPTSGPYQTNPPSPNEIKLYVQVEREDFVTRIRHDQVIDVEENQILTREITPIMKTWVDIIRKNVFFLGGKRDHVPTCLCHMLYCIATSTKYNLAFFVAKRMELVTKQARLILPYERNTRKDYGTKRGHPSISSSSSSASGQPSSSHDIDDDNDGNDEGTSHASTPSPTRFVNSLSNDIPQVFSNPPNIDPNMEAF